MRFKALGLFLLLSAVGAQAGEECECHCGEVVDHFAYGALGVGPLPLPIPVFGLGYRAQSGHMGVDTGIQVSTLGYVTQLKTRLLWQYYPRPHFVSQFYTGVGMSPSAIFCRGKVVGTFAPQAVFGTQYYNADGMRRFFEVQVEYPTLAVDHHSRSSLVRFPLVTLMYGIGF